VDNDKVADNIQSTKIVNSNMNGDHSHLAFFDVNNKLNYSNDLRVYTVSK
jgi:hypothetical protein